MLEVPRYWCWWEIPKFDVVCQAERPIRKQRLELRKLFIWHEEEDRIEITVSESWVGIGTWKIRLSSISGTLSRMRKGPAFFSGCWEDTVPDSFLPQEGLCLTGGLYFIPNWQGVREHQVQRWNREWFPSPGRGQGLYYQRGHEAGQNSIAYTLIII